MTSVFLTQLWAQKLGWTLLHFLWQGTVIAIVYSALRRVLARWLSPQGRYALACLALTAMVAAPPLTFFLIPRAENGLPAIPWNVSANLWQHLLPGFVAVWLAGVAVFSVRLFGGWRFTAHLRSASYPAPTEWQRTLEDIAARVKTWRPVRLLVSSLVEVPTVIGWLRPVILLPVSALTGLPPEHVTALLAHELAHIRRHDYLANILQSIAEAVLFYHPAIWWVSEQIRAERELCCDDLAVAISGDVLTYAQALAQLEQIQPSRLALAHAANGGSLVNRVRRLIDPSRPLTESLPGAGAAWAMTVLLLAGLGAATVHAAQSPVPLAIARSFGVNLPATRSTVFATPVRRTPEPIASEPAIPVTQSASYARETLLFDPILPARFDGPRAGGGGVAGGGMAGGGVAGGGGMAGGGAGSGRLADIAPRLDAADVHNSPRAAISTSPVLLARAELPPANRSPIPTLHAEARVVQIEVSVRDGQGHPLEGLSKQDFSVMDEGKPRAIDIFNAGNSRVRDESATPPVPVNAARAGLDIASIFSNRNAAPPPSGHSTAIVVDHTNGKWDAARWSRQAVLDLAAKGMRDERIALYVAGREDGLIVAQDYTTDRDLLLKSMREYVPEYLKAAPGAPMNSYQAMSVGSNLPGQSDPIDPKSVSVGANYAGAPRYPADALARPDEEAYEDTVEDVRLSMRALAEHLALVPGRKSMFWVSEGFRPLAITGRKWRETPAWQKTITALNEADVAVNVIDTIPSPDSDLDENRMVMKQIADETGGRVWPTRSETALAEGIEDSRTTYTLAFYLPEGDRDDKFHALQVRVNRPGVQLSYRRGYYAGKADMPDPATEKDRTGETLETVLLNQVDSTGVGITAKVGIAAGTPRGRVDFQINLDVETLSLRAKSEGWAGKVEEMFVELNAEGRTLAKVADMKDFEFAEAKRPDYIRDGVTWHLAGPLAEGATKITLAVRDANSGRVGSLTVPIQ